MTGADRAVLAGAIVVAAGLVVAFRAFRPARVAAEAPAEVPAAVSPRRRCWRRPAAERPGSREYYTISK